MFAEQANDSLAWSWDIIQIHEGSRLRLGSRPALDLKSGVEWTRKRSILLMATEGVQYVSQEIRLSK